MEKSYNSKKSMTNTQKNETMINKHYTQKGSDREKGSKFCLYAQQLRQTIKI